MPGMLVYVAPERLAALRGDIGQPWTIRRGELLARDLVPTPDWTLYVATVRDGRVHVVAYLEHVAADHAVLGDATTCDVDITPVLERLGCHGGFSTWARGPRVLTPGDADLLRYRLGLPLDLAVPSPLPGPLPGLPAPTIGFTHDETAMKLLAAVYDDLTSDANRMVLADRLLDLGDPRGEMMALQLARARSGAPATPRERELIEQHGRAWIEGLVGYLRSYEFRRGFLATAVVDDGATMQPRWYEHPAWATVEEVETVYATLVLSPALRSLRRVAIPDRMLETLARQPRPLAIDTIVGMHNPEGLSSRFRQGGIRMPFDLQSLITTQSLDRVRSMSISIETGIAQVDRFLTTRLGMRLEHVELFHPNLVAVEPARWRRVHERNRPLSLGLRGIVDGWLTVIVRQRGSIIVQLGDPSSARPPDLAPLVPAIASLGHGLRSVAIERVGEDRFDVDLRPAVAQLRRAFPAVELVSTQLWRSP